jgi:S-adenosylmethionine hydrolase
VTKRRESLKGRTRRKSGGLPLRLTRAASQQILPTNSPITLLTDFGDVDSFVGAIKGIILSINPEARIVDISHNVPPQDIQAAAFILLTAYRLFPAGSVHLAVVDPGVGSSRRPILIQAANYSFVGPDNGIFSYVCEEEANFKVFHLTNDSYFRKPLSSTFHGRDIFAPTAAALSTGIEPRKLGKEIDDLVRLKSLQPERLKSGKLRGRIIYIDRFGNCVTNIKPEHFKDGARLEVGGRTVKAFKEFFAEGSKDKLFGIWGSAGFLELSAYKTSAAKLLKVNAGEPVVLS